MKKEYFGKNILTAQECSKKIKSNDIIWLPPVNSAPKKLTEEIIKRHKELSNVHIWSALQLNLFDFMKPGMEENISYHTVFMGGLERKLFPLGAIDVHSVSYEYLDDFFEETIRPNVLIAEVSEPDDNGRVCFGPAGGAVNSLAIATAKTIILQVNPNVPFIYGNTNGMNIQEADYLCYSEEPLIEVPAATPTENEKKIADIVVSEIEDGSVIQLGIGGLSESIGYGLAQKKNLGVHTEMFTQSMKHLSEIGTINNKNKQNNNGTSVIGFGLGDKSFYDYLNKNKNINQELINIVNNPLNIMKNKKMVSINSCVSLDLTGQVSSEGIGIRQISGTGGALDFVKGANFSEEGKSFIVLESSRVNKMGVRVSNILGELPEGTPVTIPRTEVDYIVTEFGLAHVKNKTLRERTIAITNIAHPEFRKGLANSAITKGILMSKDLDDINFKTLKKTIKGEKARYCVEDGICTITMDDKKTLNSLGTEMVEELISFLEKANLDGDVKVIVLTGANDTFSSGGNIKEMKLANNPYSIDIYAKKSTAGVGKLTLAIRNTLKPVIAKIKGNASGAGMNIALACDYRISSEDAKLNQAFIKIGLLPDAGGVSLLTSLIGPAKALELIGSGDIISAQKAKDIGLLTEIYASEQLDKNTDEFAYSLSNIPLKAFEKIKSMINQNSYEDLESMINYEVEGQRLLAQTYDFDEGISSFIQKRKPYFQGK